MKKTDIASLRHPLNRIHETKEDISKIIHLKTWACLQRIIVVMQVHGTSVDLLQVGYQPAQFSALGWCTCVLRDTMTQPADIGNAYRVFVVSTAVGSWLLDCSPYFHRAVKSDDVVVTYILPAIRLVPLPYLVDGIIMPCFGGGAMDYNIVNLPHYRPPCRLQPAALGCCTNRQ